MSPETGVHPGNVGQQLPEHGVSDSIIMAITGHKTHVMLHRYSHAADASKAAAMDSLPAPTVVNAVSLTTLDGPDAVMPK